MRIKGFSDLMSEHLKSYTLNNTTVVIDGHSLFYPMYRSSGLQYVLGPESNRFAKYIKKYFETFKKSNVNCLIVFKGGHENEEMLYRGGTKRTLARGNGFILGGDYGNTINPISAKDILLQTLDEMHIKCIVCCRNDIVEECSALARELSCPVISFNIKYCFLADTYIPYETTHNFINDKNKNLEMQIFTRDTFLKHYKITIEKLILFMLLLDTYIFEENTFNNFFGAIKITETFQRKYLSLLKWLHLNTEDQALQAIFKHISDDNTSKFLKEREILQMQMSNKIEPKTNSVVNFINENEFQIKNKDPLWFEKGVYLRLIDIDYVDLYYYKIVKGSHLVEDFKADASCLICVDVIKYAYDLLTNFKGDVITFWDDNSLQYELSIKKPEYVADVSVFENGWNNVKVLLLFEHFLVETFQSFHFEALERAPADSRMLLIALVFFTRKKVGNFEPEIYSIILSYVMLNVVANKVNIELISNVPEITQKPSLELTTDKDSVLIEDCKVAAAIMRKYFEVSDRELHYIFDPKIVHPLVEFERCLKELNSLNKLCGSSYDATVYSRTYNGTFVYKILLDIKESGDAKAFITNLLNPAATVLAFVEGMIGVYNRILFEF